MNRRDLLKLFGVSSILPVVGFAIEDTEADELQYAIEAVRAPIDGQSDLKGIIVTLTDGTGKSIKIQIEEGNVTWTQPVEYEYILERGLLDRVVLGDEQPIELSFDINYSGSTRLTRLTEQLKEKNTITFTKDKESFKFENFMYENLQYDISNLSMSGKCYPGNYTNV